MTIGLNLKSESTLTDRYQTTIPDPVRKALGLGKRDKICYTIESNGLVTLSRADLPADDPLLGKFLSFLAQDLTNQPQQIQPVNAKLVDRLQALVGAVEIDIDAPLADEDE
jgi:antitoxin PrlF